VVLIENPVDDIASPLGISSNMLIKAAITRNPFLPNIGRSEHARAMKMVSTVYRPTQVFKVKESYETGHS